MRLQHGRHFPGFFTGSTFHFGGVWLLDSYLHRTGFQFLDALLGIEQLAHHRPCFQRVGFFLRMLCLRPGCGSFVAQRIIGVAQAFRFRDGLLSRLAFGFDLCLQRPELLQCFHLFAFECLHRLRLS